MAQRLSGTLRILVHFTGVVSDAGMGKYAGSIESPGQGAWQFNSLWIPRGDVEWDSEEMYDQAAASSVYYGALFRDADPEETPKWAPPPTLRRVIHSEREVFPRAVMGEFEPEIAGVYVGSIDTVVFRTRQSKTAYYAALEKEAKKRRHRSKLRVINGGNVA